MTNKDTITMLAVKEEDIDLTVIEVDNDEESIDEMVKFVSPEMGEISTISMNELEIGTNIILITDGHSATSSAGYNMSMQIVPLFGTLLFAEFGINNDGETMIIGLSEENQRILREFIPTTKQFEIDSGGRQSIVDRINEIGKDQYLRDLNERYKQIFEEEENSVEEQYEENKEKDSDQ